MVTGNKGFASIYIVIIIGAMICLALTAYTIAGGYAASSISENLTYITGRSILSEFNMPLYSRYGIFMLPAAEGRLEELARYYISKGLSGKMFVKLSADDIVVSVGEHGGLNSEGIADQLAALGRISVAKTILTESEILECASVTGEKTSENSSLNVDYSKRLSELMEESDAEYDSEGKCIKPESPQVRETRRQARELLSRYNQAMSFEDESPLSQNENKSVSSENLPSSTMNASKQSPLLSGGFSELRGDSVFINAYLADICSNQVITKENTYLNNELEYILFGKKTDERNAQRARRSLFEIRYSVNLAEVYSDSKKMNAITLTAATFFYYIPTPIAVFILASVDAAVKAKEDVYALLGGGKVSFSQSIPQIDTYNDYLLLELFFLDYETKIFRFMDIVQINLMEIDHSGFKFENYAYGFDISLNYVNKGVFKGITGIGDRNKKIEKTFVYK